MKWRSIHSREVSFYGNYIASLNYTTALKEDLGFSLDNYVFFSSDGKIAESFISDDTFKFVQKKMFNNYDLMEKYLSFFEKKYEMFEELKGILNSNLNINNEKLLSLVKKVNFLFSRCFSVLRLPLLLEDLIGKENKFSEMIEKASKYKDKIGKYFYECASLIEGRLFDEIGKRLGISSNLLKFASPYEIESFISSNKINTSKLMKRKKYVIMIEGNTIKTLFSYDAQNFIENFNIDFTKGKCGSPGYVKGKVKIILETSDLDNINEPVVAICRFSSEEFIKYFSHFVAIVTADSGVLNHAAIVAREYGIPCIVGMKDVEKKFKDGDYVEVDADNGVVRKI